MMHLPNGAPIDTIPLALRQRPQWLLWPLDPKRGKVPYRDLDHKALANKPQT